MGPPSVIQFFYLIQRAPQLELPLTVSCLLPVASCLLPIAYWLFGSSIRFILGVSKCMINHANRYADAQMANII